MVKKSNDGKCRFYEKKHEYKLGKEKLTSVTTLIHKYFKPFDSKAIARKLAKFPVNKAKKRGVRYWLAEWKKNREEGSLCHEEMEIYAKNKDSGKVLLSVFNPRSQEVVKWYEEFMRDKTSYHPEPELLIYNKEYGVAGQIDLPLIKGKKVIIADYKFTKRISKRSYDEEDVNIYPFGNSEVIIENCNYNTYTLQLSMYAYLMELEGFEVEGLYLIHCDPNGKVKEYPIEYQKDLVKSILEEFKNEMV